MSAASGEVSILVPNLDFSVDGKPGTYGVNRFTRTANVRHQEAGTTLNFSAEAAHFNGIQVSGQEDEPGKLFKPRDRTIGTTWDQYIFGNYPDTPHKETFGIPRRVEVQYLGHLNRDLFIDYFLGLGVGTFHGIIIGPANRVDFDKRQFSFFIGASSVFRSQTYGLDTPQYQLSSPRDGFESEVVTYTRVVALASANGVVEYATEVGIATKAKRDGLIRIQKDPSGGRLLTAVAFTQQLGRLALLSVVIDQFAGLEGECGSLRDGVPLTAVVSDTSEWLRTGETKNGLLERIGIDLPAILASVNPVAVSRKMEEIRSQVDLHNRLFPKAT